jgi:hypothetical protein
MLTKEPRFKTKDELINFLDKEIEKSKKKITETLKKVEKGGILLNNWSIDELYDNYWVNTSFTTPSINVSGILPSEYTSYGFKVMRESINDTVKKFGIPKEWLDDKEIYRKLRAYNQYLLIVNEQLPIIEKRSTGLVNELENCLERIKEKLEEVV